MGCHCNPTVVLICISLRISDIEHIFMNFLLLSVSLLWGNVYPSSKYLQTMHAREGMEKKEPSYTVGGDINWFNHYGEHYDSSLK